MPLISKPNYNQIFASQAPEQDKPAVFNNYPGGWGVESRPNNGKPTIKGFNYLQQTSDLKDLWILQNGAALPYDATMEYAEGAVVLKDGELQKKQGSGWVFAANKGYNLDYFAPGKSYPLHAEIMLTNGDIVKSTVADNVIDPNLDMTGWVKTNNASQILDASGLNQQEINNLSLNPRHFGGIGDGLNHPLSERYATLAEAQAVYPFAEALTDSLDYCALRAFFDFCQANFVENPSVSFNAYVHKKLYLTGAFKTRTYYGNLSLINTQTTDEIEALIQINVWQFRLYGQLNVSGERYLAVKDRKQLVGVIIGDGGSDGSGGNAFIDTINCIGFRDFGLVLINDSIFPAFSYNHNANIGSRGVYGGAQDTCHSATFSERVDNPSLDYDQYTELTVDSLPPNISGKHGFRYPVMLKHAGELYQVRSVNEQTNTIRVYPCLNFKSTDNQIAYIYGMGLGWVGNNAGCGRFGVVQSILCGVGFWGRSQYGASIDYAISEYCGVGFTVSDSFELAISYVVQNSYFENNQFNFVMQWPNSANRNLVRFLGAHALELSKAADLYNYRVSFQETAAGGRRRPAPLHASSFYINGEDYHTNKFSSYASDLTTSADFVLIDTASATYGLSINIDKANRFGISRKLVIVTPHAQELTLIPPNEWTFSSPVVLEGTDEHVFLYVAIDAQTKTLYTAYAKSKTSKVTYDPPSIATNSSVSTTVTLSGATVGSVVQAAFSQYNTDIEISAVVSAANTVTVKFKNTGSAAVDLASGTLTVKLI